MLPVSNVGMLALTQNMIILEYILMPLSFQFCRNVNLWCMLFFEVPDIVLNIQCTATNWQSILVQWGPPLKTNGIITHYIITFGRNSTILLFDNETVHTFRDLLSNTSYQFKIKAATAAGEGKEQTCNASTFPETGNNSWNYIWCFYWFFCTGPIYSLVPFHECVSLIKRILLRIHWLTMQSSGEKIKDTSWLLNSHF